MKWTRAMVGRGLLGLAVLALNASCSMHFKVRERWDLGQNRPIPLEEASATWEEIRLGKVPEPEDLEVYNEAVCDSVAQLTNNWLERKDSLSTLETTAGAVDLRVVSRNVRHFGYLEEVVPAEFVKVRRGFDSETVIDGVGCALMMKQGRTEEDPMIPDTGLWIPATGILDLDDPRRPVLELVDPTRDGELVFGGREVPLQANYTANFARDFQARQRLFPELPALLRFEKFADRLGLHRVSSFDPDKQVCVLVHGIYSNSSSWHEALNSLYADEEIRERYEFWTFGYPTGAPIPYLALRFREALEKMKDYRRSEGAVQRDMVILGHSMGGLLAKAATQSGGDEDWNKFFKVPVEELDLPEKDRRVLESMVYYEPVSGIERVVFCATPHRGSKLAAFPITRLVGDLAQMPVQLVNLSSQIVTRSSEALTPLGRKVAEEKPASIDQLRPPSGFTSAFVDKPLNPDVAYHSIIGVRDYLRDLPLTEKGDGVVPYTSAHIEGVESEVIVEGSGHGVHREPGAIEEFARLLKLP